MTFPYVYRWDRAGRKGQLCRVVARSDRHKVDGRCAPVSVMVEFEDGGKLVTSGNALRRAK